MRRRLSTTQLDTRSQVAKGEILVFAATPQTNLRVVRAACASGLRAVTLTVDDLGAACMVPDPSGEPDHYVFAIPPGADGMRVGAGARVELVGQAAADAADPIAISHLCAVLHALDLNGSGPGHEPRETVLALAPRVRVESFSCAPSGTWGVADWHELRFDFTGSVEAIYVVTESPAELADLWVQSYSMGNKLQNVGVEPIPLARLGGRLPVGDREAFPGLMLNLGLLNRGAGPVTIGYEADVRIGAHEGVAP